MNKIIFVEPERCVGCRTCEIECAVAHSKSGTLLGAIKEKPKSLPRMILDKVGEGTIPIHCQQCKDPDCLKACPEGALTRVAEGKPVMYDISKCTGCSLCLNACPYGVIEHSPDGKSITKCDMCGERLEAGGTPACAEGCPTYAIQYVAIEEVKAVPNPHSDVIAYDKTQYADHVGNRKLNKVYCEPLYGYKVNEACTMCGVCFKKCPSGAITWKKKEVAVINADKCTQCGNCFRACKFASITRAEEAQVKPA